jgi:glycopeptide antibiotics resistance protein
MEAALWRQYREFRVSVGNVRCRQSAQRLIVKAVARVLFAGYSVILAWLILFKFSVDIASVLQLSERSVNLVPFSNSSGSSGQAVENALVFIPVGVLLSVNFKRLNFRSKLLIVLGASLAAEAIQYILGIGVTDITDVMTNTLGGLIGLIGYGLSGKYIDEAHLDRFIVVAGSMLFGLFVVFLPPWRCSMGCDITDPGSRIRQWKRGFALRAYVRFAVRPPESSHSSRVMAYSTSPCSTPGMP